VRLAAALLCVFFVTAGSGCLVVGATVAAVGAVAVTTVKTASKVTVATVETTGRVASAAITSSGETTALSMETAARLAKTGMVVVVDAGDGATRELPWQPGMKLYAAAGAGNWAGGFRTAKIFREGRTLAATLQGPAAGPALQAGDVVELHR
jgi:hypothetical protein